MKKGVFTVSQSFLVLHVLNLHEGYEVGCWGFLTCFSLFSDLEYEVAFAR